MLNREVFAKVGKDLLDIKADKDVTVAYQNQDSKVTLKADTKFENPVINAQINLPQVGFELSTDEKENVKVIPNLKDFGGKLVIYPLNNKKFDFQITKKCDKTGAELTFKYDSTEKKPKFELLPAIAIKNAKITGKIDFEGIEKPAGMLCLSQGNFNVRASYNVVKDEVRAGAFYNIPSIKMLQNVGFGAILGFKELKKVQNAVLCYKMNIASNEFSAIIPIIEETNFTPSIEFHNKSTCTFKGITATNASMVEYKNKAFNSKNALQLQCSKFMNSKLSLLMENKTKFTAVYERTIPQFKTLDAKVKLSFTKEKDADKAFGFGITFQQK